MQYLAQMAPELSIASSGVQALGTIEQSRASAANAGYRAKLAGNNAQIQFQNAAFAGAEGEQKVGIQGMKNAANMGSLVANQGASGVDVNSGSSVIARESEAKVGMLDELTQRSNAAKQAYGFQVAGTADIGQAAEERSEQKQDITGGLVSAGAQVLGGVGNAARYMTYLNQNTPGGITGIPGEV